MKDAILSSLMLPLLLSAPPAFSQAKDQTLREEVRQHGFVWRTVVVGDDFSLKSFDQLIQRCDLIIRGRVVDERARISTDERNVWTDYVIEVLEVLRDPRALTKAGDRVVVTKGGGNLVIEGKPVRVDTADFPPIQWILPHVFFIARWPSADAEGKYYFAGAGLGVFALDKSKVVCRGAEQSRRSVTRAFCDKTEAEFLELLKDKIRTLSNPSER